LVYTVKVFSEEKLIKKRDIKGISQELVFLTVFKKRKRRKGVLKEIR